MGLIELFLTGVGLSMDAFAVAVCKGLGMHRINMRHAFVIALFFGVFQALMPLIGWALGSQFASFVEPVGHWIAFGLLAIIGGKMVWDAVHDDTEAMDDAEKLNIPELFLLAIATSIDAFAVGIGFALLQVDIIFAVCAIGVITFVLSLVGVVIGNQFGARFEKPAGIVGGIVLILIGVKILLEHMGVLAL